MDKAILITAESINSGVIFKRACGFTRGETSARTTLAQGYKTEHSPIRTQVFWVEMFNIPTFVSTQLSRHKFGCEHYILSRRDDVKHGMGDDIPNRDTLVNHATVSYTHLTLPTICSV